VRESEAGVGWGTHVDTLVLRVDGGTLPLSHSHSHSLSHSLTHTPTPSHTPALSHSHTHTLTHSRTLSLEGWGTHIHTLVLGVDGRRFLWQARELRPGFGFRLSGFEFWVSGFGFRVPDFGFQVSNFGL